MTIDELDKFADVPVGSKFFVKIIKDASELEFKRTRDDVFEIVRNNSAVEIIQIQQDLYFAGKCAIAYAVLVFLQKLEGSILLSLDAYMQCFEYSIVTTSCLSDESADAILRAHRQALGDRLGNPK